MSGEYELMTNRYKCWLYVNLIVEQANRELVREMMQSVYNDTECVSAPLGQWQAISCDTKQPLFRSHFCNGWFTDHFFVWLIMSRSYVWAVYKLRYRNTIAIDVFVAIFMRTRIGTGSACHFLVE
jgi:hypothetical protein